MVARTSDVLIMIDEPFYTTLEDTVRRGRRRLSLQCRGGLAGTRPTTGPFLSAASRADKGKANLTRIRPTGRRIFLTLALLCVTGTLPAMAIDARDLVYECPCSGVWVPGTDGSQGEFLLSFGLRSHRPVDSSELRVWGDANSVTREGTGLLGTLGAREVVPERRVAIALLERPVAGAPIVWWLQERLGVGPDSEHGWHPHEGLTLWPVSDEGDGHVDYVDILTDTDGDGVGDVNERIAGTAVDDAASTPGVSAVDVLALFNDGYRERLRGGASARIHHVMVVTGAVFADSGTNIRLRTVGMHQVELDAEARLPEEERVGLMDRYGADATLRFHDGPSGSCLNCAGLGGGLLRGYLPSSPFANIAAWTTAITPAHELGHVFGLAHSAYQGETQGAFRWSRGHYVRHKGNSTVMGYAAKRLINVFSSPDADCHLGMCGVPADAPDGADAVASLDLGRFQVAARRPAMEDTDGDGFVDPGDAFPGDPREWADTDGDGIGDNADEDNDNDGVPDREDAFPYEPAEWKDLDGDGIGDNADADVVDLSPFRDPALRAAVEHALGKSEGAELTRDDIGRLRALEAPSAGIRVLEGLERATNLESLVLPRNSIRDLAPLAGLSALRRLDLAHNPVSDLARVGGLRALRDLSVSVDQLQDPDLSALSDLADLQTLALYGVQDPLAQGRHLFDLKPLSALRRLRYLTLWNLRAPDLEPLAQLAGLEGLWIPFGEEVMDVSPLAQLEHLQSLDLTDNEIVDISPLTTLTGLHSLSLSGNPVADLSPVAELEGLRYLSVNVTPVSDLTPIKAIPLWGLEVSGTGVKFGDVATLPHASALRHLRASNLGARDISALAGFASLHEVHFGDNLISDVSPLASRNGVPLHELNLSGNEISEIGPLLRREIWGESARLSLTRNPLDDESLRDHIPTLESWGIEVSYDPARTAHIGDAALRALIVRQLAGGDRVVDLPITTESITRLTRLNAFHAGVADLSGLEVATELASVFLGSNLVSDLAPLADLEALKGLDLSNNLISDISPLVDNPNIDGGDWITLTGNPLSEESLNVHVPALRERDVHVGVDSVRLLASPDTRAASFDVSGYFESTVGAGADLAVAHSEAEGVRAAFEEGTLQVALGAVEGPTSLSVTATASDGTRESLAFEVSIRQVIALFPSAARPAYRGFVRVTNHSPRAGRVAIRATDDEGRRRGPVTLSLGAHATAPFNSEDLEHGNVAKGLSGGIGAGSGDWRLEIGSNLDIEVTGYARTADGFVTTLHELARRTGNEGLLPFLNPGSNTAQVSRLRLVNPGTEAAKVSVTGVDDHGRSPGSPVRLSVAPGTARTLTAADLEAGEASTGALGDGFGKWRLVVESPDPVYAMSLLESPTGHLTNLSSGPIAVADGTHTVPLFPAAGDPDGRQGFVRVVNREDRAGTVTIAAIDDAGQRHGSATLALGAGATAPFNSNDLEQGNPDKGLTGGVGTGTGDWRLSLTADIAIDVYGYIRHTDGFVTSMLDGAPVRDTHHRIGFLNPGSNRAQVSSLRLINPGDRSADVAITGRDDRGQSPAGSVGLTIPAGASRTYTAAQLEEGGTDLRGSLGDGAGKWRLTVQSDHPISVMSVLESPTGHLTNLSTAPTR